MPKGVFREGVLRLVEEEGAQLVEVLPREEYEDEHLPGAINVSLKELDAQTSAGLRKDVPVIAYCYDYL